MKNLKNISQLNKLYKNDYLYNNYLYNNKYK